MIAELLNPDNYQTSLFALPTLLTASTMLALGLMVLVRERESRVSVSFFLMTLAGGIWLLSYSMIYCTRTENAALAWSKVGHIGIVFIPPAVYHFTIASLQLYQRYKRRVWLLWEASAFLLIMVFVGDSFFSGARLYWWGYYPIYGWLGIIFVCCFFVLIALSLREYWMACRAMAPGVRALRSKALFRAFCVAYLGAFDYLPALGVPMYPFGYLPILGFVVLVDRTIRRYRLVNITPEFAAKEIINAMDDALLLLDSEGIVRVVNRSTCRLFSRAETDLEGVPVSIVAREFISDADDFTGRILNGSLRDHECFIERTKLAVSLSSFVMHDPGNVPIATVCMIRDIGKQKAAQAQIRRHTERQAALYELNLAATSTLELRGVLEVLLERLSDLVPRTATTVMLLEKNQRLHKVACFGIDEAEWQGQPRESSEATHPVLRTKDVVSVASLERNDDSPEAGYFLDQGFKSYLGLPLVVKHQVVGILSFYSREARRYDSEEINFLRSLAAQAAVAIHNSQLYEQTSRQALALEKANRVKEDFLSVMSHELRTPLNVISGYTTLVQERVMGEINAEQSKALAKVSHHAGELLFMVNGMMNATKIEAGMISVDKEKFLLTDLLNELRFLYDYPRDKTVNLEWSYPTDLPHLRSDRDKLKHVIQNLINNAFKFTDEGAVRVGARQLAGGFVEISVSDTGIGIASEELPLIFDRFRQLDSSRTRAHGGVGLGLHIVKSFTELLGGTVKVTSEPGYGSTFSITLSCEHRAISAPNPPAGD